MTSELNIFKRFADAINNQDIDTLQSLMSDDHVFIDATGNSIQGKKETRNAWERFFQQFPGYRNFISDQVSNGKVILAAGYAQILSVPPHQDELTQKQPAAWKGVVANDLLVSWQVFADSAFLRIPDKPETPVTQPGASGKKVTGLGGIFFKCKDPDQIKKWYQVHLGIEMDAYGTSFEWRQADDKQKKGFTAWSPFKENTTYFEPSQKEFMINYRVNDLDALLQALRAEGVTVCDDVESLEYGKFVHILDPEGNKIELWEADDEEYDKILNVRTK